MLELKESNAPFWLIGVGKNKTFAGSSTNIPCYAKSNKKQKELAKQIFKNEQNVEEVFLLTGVQWDHMPSGAKEEFGYIKNKGVLILNKDEFLDLNSSDNNIELNEDKYPKGVSRDPLPKKGAKLYTSPATALENKDDKLELKIEEDLPNLLSKDELFKLRKEIVLGSIYLSDYENSFKINPKYVMELFDGFVEDTWDKVLNYRDDYFKDYEEKSDEELFKLDINNIDSLYDYYTSIEDNLVVKNPLNEAQEKLIPNLNEDTEPELKAKFDDLLANGGQEDMNKLSKEELVEFANYVKNLDNISNLVKGIILRGISFAHGDDLSIECVKESTSHKYYEIGTSDNNYSFKTNETLDYEEEIFNYAIINKIIPNDIDYDLDVEYVQEISEKEYIDSHPNEIKDIIKESYTKDEFNKESKHCTDKYDIYSLKNNKDNYFVMKKGETPWEHKELIQTDIDGITHLDKLKLNEDYKLKESKIVTPVGNPQIANSFVNIDVDLDHMEVSDFIVRLAQAIRSEQTSVLEYVALRSANGITNEERTNIDTIIEEEKNHMVAFTTMLYKQLLINHKQNVDEANNEFTLPTFGLDIFSEDNKLTESISSIVYKLALKEAGLRMSDEYLIGNREDGRMYHGLGAAMRVIQDMISTSGDEVVIQNVTIADSKNENVKLEDTFNSIDELINELKSDNNYDELAYHIHEYAKTNKARALELMNKLFELERDKSPKECRDALIADLETENKQYKTEDIKLSLDGETMSQTQWDILVDVNYDADFLLQVVNNLSNAIKELNPYFKSNYNCGIAEDKYTLAEDKFNFTLLTFNGFNETPGEDLINEICKKLFEKATNYEYFIELK